VDVNKEARRESGALLVWVVVLFWGKGGVAAMWRRDVGAAVCAASEAGSALAGTRRGSLFCGKATAVATGRRRVAKSRLSIPFSEEKDGDPKVSSRKPAKRLRLESEEQQNERERILNAKHEKSSQAI